MKAQLIDAKPSPILRMSIPPGRGEKSCLYVMSSTPLASQCSQSRCNTGKLADNTSLSFHSPIGLPGHLQMKITLKVKRQFVGGIIHRATEIKLNSDREAGPNKNKRLTAQAGKILRVSVSKQSGESLLPIIQITTLDNISPVLGHH